MAKVPDRMVYRGAIAAQLGRALSRLDIEPTSPSRGSFDRTWWCWKFTDFSASRFQEGVHALAWLLTSPMAPDGARDNARLLDAASAALEFWCGLQHADGSFDEAYPFERSLAATAFSAFYAGHALRRLDGALPAAVRDRALGALARAAGWLAANGEHHGTLSNHLAAAAAALDLAGRIEGTDRFDGARRRYLDAVYAAQDPDEGWMTEYGGADPGYQGHGLFYLACLHRESGDAELGERLARACDFLAWFAHPDGTLGGEYASRGTKFAFPAGFEMLAPTVPSAAAIAGHLRRCLAAGRGVGAAEMDEWNLFPLLNNLMFAADAADDALADVALPWQADGASAIFPRAGLAVASAAGRVLAAAPGRGGVVKLWRAADGRLLYEDCGYWLAAGGAAATSHGPSDWRREDEDAAGLLFGAAVTATFRSVPAARPGPWRFLAFRLFSLTMGRLPAAARWLKARIVGVLIHGRGETPARLERRIRFGRDGRLTIEDALSGLDGPARPVARQVPVHMGSARYADARDALGAETACPPPEDAADGRAARRLTV